MRKKKSLSLVSEAPCSFLSLYLNVTFFVHFSVVSGQTLVLQGYGLSNLMRDTIYEQAFQANKISYVVHMISETYVEVSNKYLMDRVTCLGQLVALDPESDASEIAKRRQELHSGCEQAKEAIDKLVMEKRRDFDEQVEARVSKIERELKGVLPSRPPAAIKESEESLKETLDKMETADVDQFCWSLLKRREAHIKLL